MGRAGDVQVPTTSSKALTGLGVRVLPSSSLSPLLLEASTALMQIRPKPGVAL